MGIIRAMIALYRIPRSDRAKIIAAVQFAEDQHLANGITEVFESFPAKRRRG